MPKIDILSAQKEQKLYAPDSFACLILSLPELGEFKAVGAVVSSRNQEVAGSTHRSTASNLEQVANLMGAQANSASYSQRDGKLVVAIRLRGEGLVWLIGAMVCLLAASWVQLSVSAGNGWPHNASRHHWLMLIRCHFRACKALLVTSLTHVSGAITNLSLQTFTFTFTSPTFPS